jgi:uncharacterized membrane protein
MRRCVNSMNKITVVILFMIMISSMPVHALSFGTNIKNSEITLQQGGTGMFRILFYSRDEEPVTFILSLEDSPKGFSIRYPETIELNSGYESEYILIDNEYVGTKTLDVNVDAPTEAEPGEYEILLKASSVNQNEQSSIGVNTEKTFLLKVNVLGQLESVIPENPEDSAVENPVEENREVKSMDISEDTSLPVSGMVISNDSYLWIFLVFLILIISYLIYRKI